MSRARMLPAFLALAWLNTGCVLGSEQMPGCRQDRPEDCSPGWVCRSGVCFRPTTTLSPSPLADSGDASDAPDTEDAEHAED